MDLDPAQERLFWWTARERQAILLRRAEGLPREEWTTDPVFRSHHFCNVFRSDDRVSAAVLQLAQAWDDPWAAALAGRLVNRYETIRYLTGWHKRVTPSHLYYTAKAIGLNTNAYRLNTPQGLNNLDGVVQMYAEGLSLGPEVLTQRSVPAALGVMRQVKHLGGFVGYQVVLDLIELGAFTPAYVDDWSWCGPGAERGLLRLQGHQLSGDWVERSNRRSWGKAQKEVDAQNCLIHKVLLCSKDPANWPPHWRPWTIHEAEGWLCEYDKWARRTNGESIGGRKFKGRYGIDYQPAPRRAA